jgi:ATP-dependent DNA helicase RecG
MNPIPDVAAIAVDRQWLKLPSTIDRGQMRRKRSLDIPFEMIREAVVNALVHRDYEIAGAKCQLIVSSETIVIRSPGEPVEPITLEQLQSLTGSTRAESASRVIGARF